MMDLGIPASASATPLSIAEDGTVYVAASDGNGRFTLYRSTNGKATSLGELPGAPLAANASGAVTGLVLADGCTGTCQQWKAIWVFDAGNVQTYDLPRVANRGSIIRLSANGTILAQADGDAMLIQNGVLTELAGLEASGVNTSGTVAGITRSATDAPLAVVWQSGVIRALELPDGSTNSSAIRINEDGDVIGVTIDAAGRGNAMIWVGGGGMPQSINVPTSAETFARFINQAGQVLVTSLSGKTFVWSNGQSEEIEFTDYQPAFRGLGENGEVFGYQVHENGYSRGFVWLAGAKFDLGIGPDARGAEPLVANQRGDLAGYYLTADGRQRAVVWQRN